MHRLDFAYEVLEYVKVSVLMMFLRPILNFYDSSFGIRLNSDKDVDVSMQADRS